MYRKLNIRTLTIVFVLLLIVTLIVKISDSKSGDRTLKSSLTDFNLNDITSVTIYPKALKGDFIKLKKQGDDWKVSDAKDEYRADSSVVISVIREFESLKPLRMAATKEDRWSAYEVTDSLASRVIFENDDDEIASIYVGKFSYRQPKNNMQQPNMYGRPQGTMNTYVRLADEDEVYAVEGFLDMSVNRQLNDFRDKTIINSNTAQWNKMVFTYPADSSFTMTKQEGKWMVDGLLADSASVASYLQSLGNLKSSALSNRTPGSHTHLVHIEGAGLQPIDVQVALGEQAVVTSTMNPEACFVEAIDGNIMKKLFVGKQQLMRE